MNTAPEIDLTRLGYVARHRADCLDLSYADLRQMTGASARQISYLMNGKPINAGATFVLTQVLGIDLADMLPAETAKRLASLRKQRCAREENTAEYQCVTPLVPRETGGVL